MIKREIKQTMLDDLNAKLSSIVNCVIKLTEQGYLPNNIKLVKLSWCGILLEAIKQDSFYNDIQTNNIKTIFNKVINK